MQIQNMLSYSPILAATVKIFCGNSGAREITNSNFIVSHSPVIHLSFSRSCYPFGRHHHHLSWQLNSNRISKFGFNSVVLYHPYFVHFIQISLQRVYFTRALHHATKGLLCHIWSTQFTLPLSVNLKSATILTIDCCSTATEDIYLFTFNFQIFDNTNKSTF